MNKKQLKPIPKFANENEERQFWANHDSNDFLDWSQAKVTALPNLKLTKQPISLRVSTSLLLKVKTIANKKDMPYQTLIKQYIEQGLEKDFSNS